MEPAVTFVLQPQEYVNHLILDKDTGVLTVTWQELIRLLGVNPRSAQVNVMTQIKAGMYVGAIRAESHLPQLRVPVMYVLKAPTNDRKVQAVAKIPNFDSRVISIYKVVEANWKGTIREESKAGN